jgi:zinc protease
VAAALKDELAKMLKEGFTDEELKTAKSGWSQQQQLNRAEDQALASRLSNYLFIGRTLDWDATLNTRVNALTVDQVNAAMRKHVDPSKLSVVKAGDFKKAITSSNN